MMSASKALVVGGSGFIGSYLMKEINADNLDLKVGMDVRDGIDRGYSVIIFLACNQANTKKAYEENRQMYEVLDDYRKDSHIAPYLIYVSSAAVYNLDSWYALSKQLGEAYAARFGRHTILRLSNVYGHGDGHGAPDRFMRGEKTINGDGLQIRDLIPVEKVVTVICEKLDAASMRMSQIGTYNVSSGVGTTVSKMFDLFGEDEKPQYDESAPIGVSMSVLEPGRVDG